MVDLATELSGPKPLPKYVRTTNRIFVQRLVKGKCLECKGPFEYLSAGSGSRREYCSDFCRGKARHRNAKAKPLCIIEGCGNCRAYRSGLCNTHYYKLRRSGNLDYRKTVSRSLASTGYILLRRTDHPLSSSNGMLFEHRKVLFDSIGYGPHKCFWCGRQVNWTKGRATKGSLVPDHLDGDKANNSLSNLVPSCSPCNFVRGSFMAWVRKHKNDPWLWKMYHSARKTLTEQKLLALG